MIIDAHNHLVMSHGSWDEGSAYELPIEAIHDRLRRGDVAGVGLIVGGDRAFPEMNAGSSWQGTLRALGQVLRGLSRSAGGPSVVRSLGDLEPLSVEEPGLLFGIEGVTPCFDSAFDDPVTALHILAQLGVRSVQFLGGTPQPVFETGDSSLRLSRVGRDLVAEAERLGMLIDLAHLGGDEPAFADLLDAVTTPPIASHHSCRAIAGLPRALSDDGIRAIASAEGVIGVNLGSGWLNADGRQGETDDVLRHVRHIVDLVGVEHVAIGSDHVDAEAVPRDLPDDLFLEGFAGPESLGRVAGALAGAGFDSDECDRILSGNVLRVWRSALGRME